MEKRHIISQGTKLKSRNHLIEALALNVTPILSQRIAIRQQQRNLQEREDTTNPTTLHPETPQAKLLETHSEAQEGERTSTEINPGQVSRKRRRSVIINVHTRVALIG